MSHVDDGTLHAYLDGELPPVERARLEAHVAECPACRTRLEEERALVTRASELLGLALPSERVAPPPLHQLRQPRLLWRVRVPLAWAASVTLALGLGYYIGGTSYSRLPPQTASQVRDSLAPLTDYALQDRAAAPAPARTPAVAPAEPRVANQIATREEEPARGAAEAPAAGGVVATSPPSADLAEGRGRLLATEWPLIRPGPARELLGADPVGVPGLAVRSIRRSPTEEVILVEQVLDSATVIQVYQRRAEGEPVARSLDRAAAPLAAARRDAAAERLARFVGGLRVEIAGPLSADSLNRLLEQVKPIP